ncbi:MAG: ribonuclease R [Pseudanabaenaceae cyanobacterium SKYGB_i_bin29]|nr:ribonuclease R [Pseudanabaenaceae cyanobacterium SKYG29]MDW8421680.1 ribonuclease R [Pseudanabaenaceae cyanobacterium SKYGB_i_bin29]
MDKGTLVEVKLNGHYRLLLIAGTEGKKHLQATDENGITHTIHPREIAYVVPHSRLLDASQIPQFRDRVQTYLDPSQLELAWEVLQGQSTTPEQLADLLFSATDSHTCYAAYCLLREDKIYFKQKGQVYETRPPSQVEEIKHQMTVAQQKAQENQQFVDKLQARLQGEIVEWTASERQRLECLERYVLHPQEITERERTQAQEILTIAKRLKTEAAAFDLLVDLGLWSVHENLALKRSQIPVAFPPEVLTLAAERLHNPPPDMSHRLDLRHLRTYTIDDISTTEIDDGLSIDNDRIWIHIADPTRWVLPGDALELEARRRATTVYLPTGMIPMFPQELATGPMSLVQGQECCALSFGVVLAEDGSIRDWQIATTLVCPTYRLTYDDVTEMLEIGAEADLDRLYYWAKKREQWRLCQGAVAIHLPETSIKVKGDEVTLQLLEDSPSRQLVSEMMILAGEIAARFAIEKQIPVPFRSQAPPHLPPTEELEQIPNGVAKAWAICRTMSKSEVSLEPQPHAGLGLPAYVQATSPIRRYGDLIVHYQIKAALLGQPPIFTAQQVQELIGMIDAATYDAVQVERQTNRYWSLEYLRRHQDTVWQAVFLDWLKETDRLGLILLEELGLKLPIKMTRQVNRGEHLQVKVSMVNPRADVIQFQEMINP